MRRHPESKRPRFADVFEGARLNPPRSVSCLRAESGCESCLVVFERKGRTGKDGGAAGADRNEIFSLISQQLFVVQSAVSFGPRGNAFFMSMRHLVVDAAYIIVDCRADDPPVDRLGIPASHTQCPT
jgi:hypothetical protein